MKWPEYLSYINYSKEKNIEFNAWLPKRRKFYNIYGSSWNLSMKICIWKIYWAKEIPKKYNS